MVNSQRLRDIASSRYLYYSEGAGIVVVWHGGPQFTVCNEELEELTVFERNISDLPNKEHVGHDASRAHLDSVIEDWVEGYLEEQETL